MTSLMMALDFYLILEFGLGFLNRVFVQHESGYHEIETEVTQCPHDTQVARFSLSLVGE